MFYPQKKENQNKLNVEKTNLNQKYKNEKNKLEEPNRSRNINPKQTSWILLSVVVRAKPPTKISVPFISCSAKPEKQEQPIKGENPHCVCEYTSFNTLYYSRYRKRNHNFSELIYKLAPPSERKETACSALLGFYQWWAILRLLFCQQFNDLHQNSQFYFGQTNLWHSNFSGKTI